MSIRQLELALAQAKEERRAAADKCSHIAQQLRWARVAAGVYVSPGAALFDALERSGEVTAQDLIELLGCEEPRARSILFRGEKSWRLRRVRRGVYARAKK